MVVLSSFVAWIALTGAGTSERLTLDAGFANPPAEAKLRAYWWWLNGNVDEAAIHRDLEEMAAKGFGGAIITDAGGASQDNNANVPAGPAFFSPRWRELFRYTLREANRLGLEMSLNIQSGLNLGGPMVKAEDAPKKLTWSERTVTGGGDVEAVLSNPSREDGIYQDLFVVAFPVKPNDKQAKLTDAQEKALIKPLHFSAPETVHLLADSPNVEGEEAALSKEVVDLTGKMTPDGVLHWKAPAGRWQVLRFGWTLSDHRWVSTSSDGWKGYAIDPFDRGAFDRYWKTVLDPLLQDAGPLAGTTLRYFTTDSWEVEVANWTPSLRTEFRKRRGYDLVKFLPIITGRILDRRSLSNRFLNDLRRTMGDLAIDNHYRPFRDYAHEHGILIHPESGGPHAVPVDSLQCLGFDDAPMSEFWAKSWRHRVKDEDRFFVKQPASAAHTNGRRYVLAEGFTTIGPHWQETLWDNLKPSFDRACCEGLNRLVWHAFVCSPESAGVPGQQYFAGTHLNPNVTWWPYSKPFFDYLNRCQFMLQRGKFVADVLYYYGNHVPNFAQLKSSDPAGIGRGYDYDVAAEEVLLHRVSVQNGRIVLPDGMSYRALALPNQAVISLPVMRKVRDLLHAGATVIGMPPAMASSRLNADKADYELAQIMAGLWPVKGDQRQVGAGMVFTKFAGLVKFGLTADFQQSGLSKLEWIHRREAQTDFYFVSSQEAAPVVEDLTFRVAGKVPELWNPVTGERRRLTRWSAGETTTKVRVSFQPYGSWFVVFRESGVSAGPLALEDPTFTECLSLDGKWAVGFDPKWGGPEKVQFDSLQDWTTRPEPEIRFYSGTATYRYEFDAPEGGQFLDLGVVRELAEVTLNGKNLGVVWAPPFRVNVAGCLKPKGNKLEVRVTNFWPNRLIGDQALPGEKRLTKTNIRAFRADSKLMPSGLLGPVKILRLN